MRTVNMIHIDMIVVPQPNEDREEPEERPSADRDIAARLPTQ